MELNALDYKLLVADSHDVAVLCAGTDLKFRWKARLFDYKRMIAGEIALETDVSEDSPAVSLDFLNNSVADVFLRRRFLPRKQLRLPDDQGRFPKQEVSLRSI